MDWLEVLAFIGSFVALELIALLLFYLIRKKYDKSDAHPGASIVKGMLERFVVLLGLAAKIPGIVIFFGAIKLGTRLKDEQDKISNDYFLIGNTVSIVIAICEFLLFKKLNG